MCHNVRMEKDKLLVELEREIAEDKKLPLLTANLVFGEGNSSTEILFIGEAPGQNEDIQKRPFVGKAGQLLRNLIKKIGWREADVYITNIVKRRPPGNRDPLPEEIEAYKPYLTRQIEIIKPKLIVPLGRFATNYFLPLAKITRDQGKIFRAGEWRVFPLFHPAAALRSPDMMKALEENFMKLPLALEQIKNPSEKKIEDPLLPKKDEKPKQSQLF